jgi:hypothetical protein
MTAVQRLATLLTVALLAACAAAPTPRSSLSLAPGSTAAAVIAARGRPVAEHLLPGGGRRLEYGSGAYAKQVQMFDFDASDRLVASHQVRDEAHFAQVQVGMSSKEVMTRLGRPSRAWAVSRPQHLRLWAWRYDSLSCNWFVVGLGDDDRVAETSYAPDPLCSRNRTKE